MKRKQNVSRFPKVKLVDTMVLGVKREKGCCEFGRRKSGTGGIGDVNQGKYNESSGLVTVDVLYAHRERKNGRGRKRTKNRSNRWIRLLGVSGSLCFLTQAR